MNNDPKHKKRRPHYANYWRAKWRDKREAMSSHLDALNTAKIMKADERVRQVQAITHMLPTEPMPATRLRDQVAENWNSVYGEDLNSTRAWCLVRLCIGRGLFIKDKNSMYTVGEIH